MNMHLEELAIFATYFCGRIFDRQKYAELVKAKGIGTTDYFPAYRKEELG